MPFMLSRLKGHIASSLGLRLPEVCPKKGKVFLLYAVSMGETKIAAALFHQLKKSFPAAQFYALSATKTGHAEAKKSMKDADGHFLMPVDLSWTMRRFLKRLSPDVVITIESDFWLNFLRVSKELGALTFLISGKVSKSSFERFQKVPFFSRKLFSLFDAIFAQNTIFQDRFIRLGASPDSVTATGNLKFDIPFVQIDPEGLKRTLGIQARDKVVVIASTHAGEEEALLRALRWSKIEHLKVILVPRHPERFAEVESGLLKSCLSTISYSRIEQKTGDEQVILIDAMGLVLSLYQLADLAIVGGSFFPALKGHNIFEPVQAEVPVLFGPYMSDQKDLVESVLAAEAGMQVPLEDLGLKVEELLLQPAFRKEMQAHGKRLSEQVKGASSRTCEALCEKICFLTKETFEV